MLKLLNLVNIASLGVAFIFSGSQQTTQSQRAAQRKRAVTTVSPGRRYAVRFSDERSDGNAAGKLWGSMTIRDLRSGDERGARVAEGQRGSGNFEGFSRFESSRAWSPDGMYMAYWDNHCQDEPSVPGGVVCQLHEVHFLKMTTESSCRENLVLSRYAFNGWARGQGHTVLEALINEDGRSAKRLPCAERTNDEAAQQLPVRDADQAISLFQQYWDSIVLSGISLSPLGDQSQKKILAQSMSERVRNKKLSAHLGSYREVHKRVNDTLSRSERETLILYGSLADIDRAGECWIVESFAGCPCSEVSGYVDAKTGQLTFVWIMPEG